MAGTARERPARGRCGAGRIAPRTTKDSPESIRREESRVAMMRIAGTIFAFSVMAQAADVPPAGRGWVAIHQDGTGAFREGRFDEALAEFRMALSTSDTPARRAVTLNDTGNTLRGEGRDHEATAALEHSGRVSGSRRRNERCERRSAVIRATRPALRHSRIRQAICCANGIGWRRRSSGSRRR